MLRIGLFVKGPNFGDLGIRKPKGLDGMQIKAIPVFLQALRDKISLKDVNKTLFPVTVDLTTKVSPELTQLLHLKYPYKLFFRLYDQRFYKNHNHNIVDIKTKKYSFIFIDKTIDIGNECLKAVLPQHKDNNIIPSFRETA